MAHQRASDDGIDGGKTVDDLVEVLEVERIDVGNDENYVKYDQNHYFVQASAVGDMRRYEDEKMCSHRLAVEMMSWMGNCLCLVLAVIH